MKHWWFATAIAWALISPALAVTDEEYVARFKPEAMAPTPVEAIESALREQMSSARKNLRKKFSGGKSYVNKDGKRCYPGLNVPCGYQF